MNDSLKGLRILNTRPAHQSKSLTQSIEKLGGTVIVCPTIKIVPLLPMDYENLSSLGRYDIAIFTSVNAVTYFFSNIPSLNFPSTIKVVAIGQATANHLQTYGIIVSSLPTLSNSESLLSLPLFQHVRHKAVLIVKGKGGRDLIPSTLKDAGALVTELAVYERQLPDFSQNDLEEIWHNKTIDIILLTSETAMHNLRLMFTKHAFEWLQSKPCLVISSRLSDSAKEIGFKQIFVTKPDNILQGLIEAHNELASYKKDKH